MLRVTMLKMRMVRMLLMVMLMLMVRLVRMLMVRMLQMLMLMLILMLMLRMVRKADDVGWCNGTPRYCFPNFYWQPSDIHKTKMTKMVLVADIHKTFS